jgi:hypothetical protein
MRVVLPFAARISKYSRPWYVIAAVRRHLVLRIRAGTRQTWTVLGLTANVDQTLAFCNSLAASPVQGEKPYQDDHSH